MLILANTFNVNMLKKETYLFFSPVDLEIVKYKIKENKNNILSVVGNLSIASVLSIILDYPVKLNRVFYTKKKDDIMIIANIPKKLIEPEKLSLTELNQINVNFWMVE
jgi:hypothetical protein